jgi:Domain of unknown function (DUF4160)
MIFTNDHGPPHVHVFNGGAESVIELLPLAIRENYRMSRAQLRRAVDLVADNHELLVQAWREIHGP